MDRLCEVCNLIKEEKSFKERSTICKRCAVVAGVHEHLQRRKRKDLSSLDNKMCTEFIRNQILKPTGWEMTL